jgi:hypothetical protein
VISCTFLRCEHDLVSESIGPQCKNQQHVSSALNRLLVGANQGFNLHALWQSTSRTLSNLDFEHQHEMQRLERSRTDLMLSREQGSGCVAFALLP